ncbi:hypothetical protein HK405_003602, partial [Cladochytrium tenue]
MSALSGSLPYRAAPVAVASAGGRPSSSGHRRDAAVATAICAPPPPYPRRLHPPHPPQPHRQQLLPQGPDPRRPQQTTPPTTLQRQGRSDGGAGGSNYGRASLRVHDGGGGGGGGGGVGSGADPPRWILPPSPPISRTNEAGRPYPSDISMYSLGRVIGRGGFGVVYQSVSKHEDTYGEEVAIKALDKRLMTETRMQQRVRSEVEIHWQLEHPSVLRLLTYFEDATHVYLVTELCANGELYGYVRDGRGGPLSEAEGRTAMYQIVSGMMYLHACGVMHRDLKLSNILLTKKYHLVRLLAVVAFESAAVKNTLEKVSRVEYYLPDSLSDPVKDLIRRLLIKDPLARLPLEQILSHPWFALPKLPLKPVSTATTTSASSSSSSAQDVGAPPATQLESPISQHQTPSSSSLQQAGSAVAPRRPRSFTTARLKPMVQQTRHGTVELTAGGEVVIDFASEPCVFVASSDSRQITLEWRGGDKVECFDAEVDELPAAAARLVKYAAKFIELVRSKTPKVVFYSPQAKCTLMENGPAADFEMAFYDGLRLHHSPAQGGLSFERPGSGDPPLRVPLPSTGGSGGGDGGGSAVSTAAKLRLPPPLLAAFRHAQDCLRRCVDIERTAAAESGGGSFPIVVRAAGSPRARGAGETDADGGGGGGNTAGIAASVVSSSATVTGAAARPAARGLLEVHASGGSEVGRATATPTAAGRVVGSTEMATTLCMTEVTSNGGYSGGRGAAPAAGRVVAEAGAGSSAGRDLLFVPGTAWCVSSAGGRIELLFVDGARVVVDARRQRLVYFAAGGEPEEAGKSFVIDSSLPGEVKARLSILPSVLAHFKSR